MTKADAKNSKSTTRRTLHYYWQEVIKYKWYSLGVLILTPVVIIIRNVLGPFVFADMVGKISAGIAADEIIPTLLPEVLGYLALYALNNLVFEKLRLFLCWRMELKAMFDLSNLAFSTINAQSMQFHSDRFSGSLVSQTNKFVSAFERLADTIIWELLPFISYLAAVCIILWPQAPVFVLILLGFVIIYTLISGLTFKNIGYLNDKEAATQNKQTGQLADSITNILSVKSYAKETHERHRYANFQRASFNASNNVMWSVIKRDLMFSVVLIGTTAVLLFFLMTGSTWFGLSVATLILLINYSETILVDLHDVAHIFKDINRVFGDAKDMTEILDMKDEVVDEPGAKELSEVRGAVRFEKIVFQHKDATKPIFEDFSLEIKDGERVGLVGVSGSGKTTLTKLLLRFANLADGEILIDGQNIWKVTQKSLRENIAYVPQETALFHRSVADNIAYARPDASFQEIERAAKLANADEFIRELPQGYDTLVGERGIKLSGGQRQRIAIARAILKDAPILVLDEATSALDSESEAAIQSALNNLMKDRTSVVVAHRLSTVANLDRIIVLKNGKIVEQGAHQELLEKNGEYAKLWARQSGAFLDEK